MATSLLDLVGVLLLGLVAALAVTVVQSQPIPPQVATVTEFFGLGDLSTQDLVVALAAAAAAVLLLKSVVSSFLNRRVLIFLANRQALVSARLTKALLSRPLRFVESRSSQQTSYALIQGTSAATVSVLGQVMVMFTEVALLLVLSVALFLVSPVLTLGSIAYFAVVALVLQRAMGGWAARIGTEAALSDIASLNAIQEALAAYREVVVSGRRQLYAARIQALRWTSARVNADAAFISMLPKYIFESALVIGGLALAAVLFSTQTSVDAVATLAVFLAAASRVMPSILRLQGGFLGLRSAASLAAPTYELSAELAATTDDSYEPGIALRLRERIRAGFPDFDASLLLEDVWVRYPGAPVEALRGVSLSVAMGRSLALVGRSGAGKSTLADVILGVTEPDRGIVLTGGLAPLEAVTRWPGAVAYVPQNVALAEDSVRANVAFGLPAEAIDDELVWEALEKACLASYLREERDGLATLVGERGVRFSGGQRQRLGIARALYTRPRLLVLDEATSALDAETEMDIASTIEQLEGDVTLIIIAHRLSTVRNADRLAFMQSGEIVDMGTFDEVRQRVPSLGHQARLMGL